jgi:hypothetical protein
MLDTKLILIDGLPGAGKSTACQWLERQLRRNRLPARWIFEFELGHPLLWWDFWDGARYQMPDFERFSPAEMIEACLEKWQNFTATARGAAEIQVVEGALFCLPVWFHLQGDATPAQLLDYGRRVHDIIKEAKPILIYLRQDDVAGHLRRVCQIRGQAYEAELTANMERTRYLRHRGLKGLAGTTQLWQETARISDSLFAGYSIRKLAIETSGGDWAGYQQIMLDWLSLSLVADEEVARPGELERLAGRYRYRAEAVDYQCQVVLEDGHLIVHSPEPEAVGFFFAGQPRWLAPIDNYTFYAGVSPVVITFLEDASGVVQTMRVDATKFGGGQVRVWDRLRSYADY